MLKSCPICYASYEDDESAWGQSEFQRHLLYDHNFGPTTEQPQVDDPLTDYVSEKIIAVKQGNILATSFHPELTRDVSLHKQFVKMVKESKN